MKQQEEDHTDTPGVMSTNPFTNYKIREEQRLGSSGGNLCPATQLEEKSTQNPDSKLLKGSDTDTNTEELRPRFIDRDGTCGGLDANNEELSLQLEGHKKYEQETFPRKQHSYVPHYSNDNHRDHSSKNYVYKTMDSSSESSSTFVDASPSTSEMVGQQMQSHFNKDLTEPPERLDTLKRVSSLDPGSVSTVSDKIFFGDGANCRLPPRAKAETRSSRVRKSSYQDKMEGNYETNKDTTQQSPQKPSIFITDTENDLNEGQLKPTLPPRPSITELPPRALHLTNGLGSSDHQQIQIANNLSENFSNLTDLEEMKSLGITEELINEQIEIEKTIKRQQLQIDAEINELHTIPDIINSYDSNDDNDFQSIQSDEASDGNGTRYSMSQLEIPNNLSRSNSANSYDSESEAESSIIAVDLFATGDITEAEFISLLPPVPDYSQTPSETEISIPGGKAIDILTINDNHPDESPPKYTPLPEALKNVIRRPQFSQTGGDSQTYSRRQQEQLRQIESRIQEQERSDIISERPPVRRHNVRQQSQRPQYVVPMQSPIFQNPFLGPLLYRPRRNVLFDNNLRVRRVYPMNYISPNLYRTW